MCFTLRLHMSAAPPQGGLTPALGGKEHSPVSCSFRSVLRLRLACSSDSSRARCLFGCCAGRAHMSHALRLPASEAMGVIGWVCSAGRAASETTGGKFMGRAQAPGLRCSAVFHLRPLRVRRNFATPRPPNNSFKPTPCRGVSHVLCATLARVRRPATGRLNSSVRPHKEISHGCNSEEGRED